MTLDLTQFQEQIHETALKHGWWDAPRTDTEVFCLFQSELYEAFEYYRKGKKLDEVWLEGMSKREGIVVDLGDFIIRILDYLAYKNFQVKNPGIPCNYKNYLKKETLPELIIFCTKTMIKDWLEDKDLEGLQYLIYQTFTFCLENSMPIEQEIKLKAEYNKSRPYRHGNKIL